MDEHGNIHHCCKEVETLRPKLAEVTEEIIAENERYSALIEWEGQSPDSDDIYNAIKHNLKMLSISSYYKWMWLMRKNKNKLHVMRKPQDQQQFHKECKV